LTANSDESQKRRKNHDRWNSTSWEMAGASVLAWEAERGEREKEIRESRKQGVDNGESGEERGERMVGREWRVDSRERESREENRVESRERE